LIEGYGVKFGNQDSIKIQKVRFEVILKDGKEHVFKISDFDDYRGSSYNFCTYLIALKVGYII
jgi:coenzyme F420 hydrogenase subunit beta